MNFPLTDSPHLSPVPAISDPANAVELTDKSYTSWTEMFEENPEPLDYLLKPGDYRCWGPLIFSDLPGNTESRPKTVRYYNPGVDDTLHPVRRWCAALVDSLRFELPGTKHWLMHGLTVNRPSQHPTVRQGAHHITIDSCLIEYPTSYGFRLRGSHCTIQRCVIREAINPRCNQGQGDSVGIQVREIEAPILGIQILDNEIYNAGDCIALTGVITERGGPVEVLIEGNDLYLEPRRYIDGTNTTWDENAIDIKVGSDRPKSTIVRNNRMWGYRHNAPDPIQGKKPQARGELFVINNFCRNAVVADNIMGEAPRGMKDENWPEEGDVNADTPRKIVFRNNQFYDIRDYSELDAGAITQPIAGGISFVDNYFARSTYLADVSPPAWRDPPPAYTGNILIDVDHIQRRKNPLNAEEPPSQYNEQLNTVATAPHGYESYERKRWTGPEFALGAVPRSESTPD